MFHGRMEARSMACSVAPGRATGEEWNIVILMVLGEFGENHLGECPYTRLSGPDAGSIVISAWTATNSQYRSTLI